MTVQACPPITADSELPRDSGQAAQVCLFVAERWDSPLAINPRPFFGLSSNHRFKNRCSRIATHRCGEQFGTF